MPEQGIIQHGNDLTDGAGIVVSIRKRPGTDQRKSH